MNGDNEEEAERLYGELLDHCKCFAFQVESAPETGYLHFQGYFELELKQRYEWIQKNVRHFEYIRERKGTQRQAWLYATKEDTRVAGPWTYGTPEVNEKAKDTTYQEALAAPTVRDGMKIIKTNKPRDYCLYGNAIERNLNAHHIPLFNSKYKLTDFTHAPLTFGKTTLVYGASNTGKTSFVIAHFKNPLIVSHIDTLKKLSPDNDAIVFDDMSFSHWPPENVIHLVDTDFDRDIHVRYGTIHIPAHTVKVFTHNSKDIFYKQECPEEQKAAINRRVNVVHVPFKLYGPALMADVVDIQPIINDDIYICDGNQDIM